MTTRLGHGPEGESATSSCEGDRTFTHRSFVVRDGQREIASGGLDDVLRCTRVAHGAEASERSSVRFRWCAELNGWLYVESKGPAKCTPPRANSAKKAG